MSVIERIAPDFELLDSWRLPVVGGPDDFDEVIAMVTSRAGGGSSPWPVRFLFAVRYQLGRVFGWDRDTNTLPIPGCAETSLRDRLPDELRGSVEETVLVDESHPDMGGFNLGYRTDDEWAAELSNNTVHGVLQLTWVPEGQGRHRGRLNVYVKPRGRSGRAYLRFISPFRHLVVYPALLRRMEREWAARRMR